MVEQPPARGQQRVQVTGVVGQAGAAHVLGHADAGDGVERPVVERPGSPAPGSRPGRPAPRRRRPLAGAARPARAESVTPTARTPYVRAAWMAKVPQPQPTSSTRMPGSQPQLAATRSSLARCASSSVARPAPVGVSEVGAGVDQRRAEHQLVEVVADVVVVGRTAALSRRRVCRRPAEPGPPRPAAAAAARGRRGAAPPPAPPPASGRPRRSPGRSPGRPGGPSRPGRGRRPPRGRRHRRRTPGRNPARSAPTAAAAAPDG